MDLIFVDIDEDLGFSVLILAVFYWICNDPWFCYLSWLWNCKMILFCGVHAIDRNRFILPFFTWAIIWLIQHFYFGTWCFVFVWVLCILLQAFFWAKYESFLYTCVGGYYSKYLACQCGCLFCFHDHRVLGNLRDSRLISGYCMLWKRRSQWW